MFLGTPRSYAERFHFVVLHIYILSHFSLAKQVTRNLLKKIVLRPICDLPSYPLRMK